MLLRILPVEPTLLAHSFTTVLDGARFTLHFHYSVRNESWYMDIDKADGTRLRSGARITSGYILLLDPSDEDLPSGALFVLDLEQGSFDDPTVDEFGERFALCYMSIDNLEESS